MLDGVRVLDLTLNLPGPYATHALASLGADVVKLEPPRGDPARSMGAFFERLNRGKRSVALDLRDPSAREALDALIGWADVLVEGFRPGVTERLGCGPDAAHARNPRLVYCRISAFGQQGPRRAEPGHDLNLQALTGLAHLERDARGRPRANRLPLADLSAAMTAVAAIGLALGGPRDRVVLDLAMADALLSWTWACDGLDPSLTLDQAVPGPLRRLVGPLRRRLSRDRLYAMPQYGLYRAADGWLALGVVDEQKFWEGLCDRLGLGRYRALPMPARTLLGPVLRPALARKLRQRPLAHWLAVFEADGLPVTAVRSVEEAVREAQFARVVRDGAVLPPLPGARLPDRPAPGLGEHTASVLAEARAQRDPAPAR